MIDQEIVNRLNDVIRAQQKITAQHEYVAVETPQAGVWQFLFNVGGLVYRLFGRKIILLKHTAQLNIKAVAIPGTSCSFLFVPRSR